MQLHMQGVAVDFSSHTDSEEELQKKTFTGSEREEKSGNDQAQDASESEKGSDLGLVLTGNTGAT